MPLSPALVATVAFGYLFFLFGVAYWAERRKDRGRSIISNPYVYALSTAVYCTSWTFYGSVGKASLSGFQFLAVYLGPTLVAFSWWTLLRKMVRISRDNHITSISDFIASRYGKNGRIGALVTVMVIVGITPYIGLQLKAVSNTFEILTRVTHLSPLQAVGGPQDVFRDTAFSVAVVLGVFGGMFGARRLDPSERHEGMVAAVALESVVKLVALLVVGVFVTWGLFGGLRDIFTQLGDHPLYGDLLVLGGTPRSGYTSWFTLLVLSASSVMLLPRQFHVMVVENCDEHHIRHAMWLFPLYLFLINLFVAPIAFGGLLLFQSPALADTFVLRIPLRTGHRAIALVAFLGGLSAATGMVVVSSVAISTMFLNNLLMPVLLRLRWKGNLGPVLLQIKRVGIMGVILLGYAYHRLLGGRFMLVDIGLLSFGAAVQLAPTVLGGLFWRKATARGAVASLTTGSVAWLYLFLVPSLARAGWLPETVLTEGPFGLSLLRPTAFLGLEGLDQWSHGLFWSMLLNLGAYLAVSLCTRPGAVEREQMPRFVDAMDQPADRHPDLRLSRAPSVGEFEGLLAKFLGPDKARQRLAEFFGGEPFASDVVLSDDRGLALRGFVERTLAGAVGPVAASQVVERYLALKGTTLEEIFDVFGAVSISLEESREELGARVRELSVLFEASKRLAGSLDEDAVINGVLELIESEFGMDCQGVFWLERGRLVPGVARGFAPGYLEAVGGAGPACSYLAQAVDRGGTVFLSGPVPAGEPTPVEVDHNPGLQSVIATPIVHENRTLGVLAAGSTERKGYFSEKFVEAFEALAHELGLAVVNARLYAEIRELNRTLEQKVSSRTRELEEANRNLQELDRLKSEFLANMSHELRTPMNSILGYTQLVLDGVDGPVTPQQRESLERVENNAQHLLKLINDILDLSKIEAGRMELAVAPVDLGALARDAAEDLAATAAAKGLWCRVAVGDGDLRVEGDPDKLREVLNNLIINAIKFTDHGGVEVRVSARDRDGAPGVEVAVVDTGVGIPAESLGEVFEAFKQVDGSATRAHGGTGLGLSISRRLVELHGGRIGVESRVGEGSRFWVWLPRLPGGRT